MAENDIYNSEKRYSEFKENLDELLKKPKASSKRKYYCRNPANLKYYKKLFLLFETKDISYIRRMRLFQTLKLITYSTEHDLAGCQRPEINKIVSFMHSVYKSPKSKSDFIKDIRHLWKSLFPEKDEKGREDETIVPYVVRHLSAKMDKSREKLRNDRLDFEEYEKLVGYFSKDARLQCYITLAHESLGRPQEILYIKIRNIELFDNHAKLYISEHGKEGCGFLLCIDSYPYLMKWLESHPFKSDPNAYLFILSVKQGPKRQLNPVAINMHLKKACAALGINKSITCYSLKRNGVTFRKIMGESDVEIQHVARWTSTKQISTYDYTNQEDMLKKQLARKGLLEPDKGHVNNTPKTKTCKFCNSVSGFTDKFCHNCKRPLDRKDLAASVSEGQEIIKIRSELENIQKQLNNRAQYDDALIKLLSIPEIQSKYKELRKGELGN
ncbi:MAG: tyrosine-type recombinase/integrase [Thermodesulfobacteriota bacterium]